jgi:hypothetical protein
MPTVGATSLLSELLDFEPLGTGQPSCPGSDAFCGSIRIGEHLAEHGRSTESCAAACSFHILSAVEIR